MKKAIVAIIAMMLITASANAQDAAGDLARRNIEHRAVEAVIWGMPAVNYDLMLRAYAPTKALFDHSWKLPDVERVSTTVGSGPTK